MSVFWMALGLFMIGLLEFCIDQYQKIVLSRLRFWPTVIFQWLNQLFTFFVNVFVFGTIMDFWSKFKEGHYEWSTLMPYLAYVHGCVIGTGIALLVYRHNKNKQSKEKALKLLEKARSKKKKLHDIQEEINIETILDDVDVEDLKQELKDQVVANASKRINASIDEAFEGRRNARESSNNNVQDKENNADKAAPPSTDGPAQTS